MSPSSGHLYLVGAPSSTCDHAPGANRVELRTRYHVQVTGLQLPDGGAGSFETTPPTDMILEDGRSTLPTVMVRSQIRDFERGLDYRGGSLDQWPELAPGMKHLVLVGPRLNRLASTRWSNHLKQILSDTRCTAVEILLTDPELFEIVQRVPEARERERLTQIWDKKPELSWRDQATQAETALNALQNLSKGLPELAAAKLSARLSHTLLPIGAIVRDPEERTAVMAIEVLPVGLFSTLHDTRPTIRISRRDHGGLFDYYWQYITQLLRAAEEFPLHTASK